MCELRFESPPRMSYVAFQRVLARSVSPALVEAQAIYELFLRHQIDPAIGLAFFYHESKCGTVGIVPAHDLKNWGAVRTAYDATLGGRSVVIPGRGQFAKYPTWTASVDDWCRRIKGRYVNQGMDTVAKALPVYAPRADKNKPDQYAATICKLVNDWSDMAESPLVSSLVPGSATLTCHDLRRELPRKYVEKPFYTRLRTTGLVLHYNGPAVPVERQRWPGLREQLLIDARHQMAPGALGAPSGGDGIQYHACVDADGKIYQLRDWLDPLWHCGNETGNDEYLSIHLPLGGAQAPTSVQWQAVLDLMTALSDHYHFPHSQCVGHRELSATECPGDIVMAQLRAWRTQQPPPTTGVARVSRSVPVANVRQGPGRAYPVVGKLYANDTFVFGGIVEGEAISGNNRWAQRIDGSFFVHTSLLTW